MALALIATACAGGSGTGTTAAAGSGPTTAPAGLGSRLEPVISGAMRDLAIPGAVVLVRTPTEEYREAFGTRVVRADDPVQVGDHFRVGSNTKTMTGTVVLQLVQEGRIALTDPISKYRPDVPNGGNITIAQMLDMRSGLYSYTELEPFNKILDEDPTRAWQPEELVALGLAQPPYFPPGQGYHYSNTNTVLPADQSAGGVAVMTRKASGSTSAATRAACSAPVTGRPVGSSSPIWARTVAWSQ
jgi:D-alanyl-D-alanine carboxypeptidase